MTVYYIAVIDNHFPEAYKIWMFSWIGYFWYHNTRLQIVWSSNGSDEVDLSLMDMKPDMWWLVDTEVSEVEGMQLVQETDIPGSIGFLQASSMYMYVGDDIRVAKGTNISLPTVEVPNNFHTKER